MKTENKGRFVPGKSGNPGGKPVGARNTLNTAFLKDLTKVWKERGLGCLERLANEDPAALVRACVALVPKEIAAEIKHRHITEMPDEELYELIRSGSRTLEAEEGASESSELH